jgi:hypothetical protein
MITLLRRVTVVLLLILVVTSPLPSQESAAQGTLISDYFGNDPIAVDIANGIITDYTFSGSSPSNIQYKILSAFRMLDYSNVDWSSSSRLQTFRIAFQRSHGIPETDFITSEFMILLDGEMYEHEQKIQEYIVDFPIDESFYRGGQYIEYVPPDPVEPTKDHIRYFFSFLLGSLPERIAPLTLENVYYFFRYQSFGIIEYDGGWTLDYTRGIYGKTNAAPSHTTNVAQTFHEYGHQIDDMLYGYFSPHVGMVDTQGFYEILFDMGDTRTGAYGTYAMYLPETRFVSQYADGWQHPQYPGYFSVAESFAESFALYITHGRLYRELAALDQNYERQYNWLKDNVFDGIEYDTGSESCISHGWPSSWNYNNNQLPPGISDTLEYCHVPANTSYDNPVFSLSSYVTERPMPISGLAALDDSPTELGQATTLTATVTAGTSVTYTWDFGDGDTGSGAVVHHTYPTIGVYTAIVTASNPVSALTATTTVTVEEVIAGLSAINDSPTELGQTTTLTATVTAGSNVTYSWAFGDGETGSGAEVTHTYPDIGIYMAVVTVSNSVSTITATTHISITITPSGPAVYIYLPMVLRNR